MHQVLKQLPEKVDTVYKCPLAFEQRELYDDLVKKYTDVVKDPNLKTGSGASVLMDLRKAANHHLLHRIQYTDDKMRQMSNLMLEVGRSSLICATVILSNLGHFLTIRIFMG